MKAIPLHLLEGLIHNLRTPLNVVIGYAQQPVTDSARKQIYNAGINLDDQLQQLLDSLSAITEETIIQPVYPWLEAELCLLKNILTIKRRFKISIPDIDPELYCTFSGQELSIFTEELLLEIASLFPDESMELMMGFHERNLLRFEVKLPKLTEKQELAIRDFCLNHQGIKANCCLPKPPNHTLLVEVTL